MSQRSTKELSLHIAAILNHPDTPLILYDAIADALCEMSNEIDFHSAGMIAVAIVASNGQKDKKEKDGK